LKKLTASIFTGVLVVGVFAGTGFAKEGNNGNQFGLIKGNKGNHYGWQSEKNPHYVAKDPDQGQDSGQDPELTVEEQLREVFLPHLTNFGGDFTPEITQIVVTETEIVVHTIGYINTNDNYEPIFPGVEKVTGKQVEHMFYHAGTSHENQTLTIKFVN
jgi:hypothetical protein